MSDHVCMTRDSAPDRVEHRTVRADGGVVLQATRTTEHGETVRCWTCGELGEDTSHPDRADGTPDFCSLNCLETWMPPRDAWPDGETGHPGKCLGGGETFDGFSEGIVHAKECDDAEVFSNE